jgi:hypothetical protein
VALKRRLVLVPVTLHLQCTCIIGPVTDTATDTADTATYTATKTPQLYSWIEILHFCAAAAAGQE